MMARNQNPKRETTESPIVEEMAHGLLAEHGPRGIMNVQIEGNDPEVMKAIPLAQKMAELRKAQGLDSSERKANVAEAVPSEDRPITVNNVLNSFEAQTADIANLNTAIQKLRNKAGKQTGIAQRITEDKLKETTLELKSMLTEISQGLPVENILKPQEAAAPIESKVPTKHTAKKIRKKSPVPMDPKERALQQAFALTPLGFDSMSPTEINTALEGLKPKKTPEVKPVDEDLLEAEEIEWGDAPSQKDLDELIYQLHPEDLAKDPKKLIELSAKLGEEVDAKLSTLSKFTDTVSKIKSLKAKLAAADGKLREREYAAFHAGEDLEDPELVNNIERIESSEEIAKPKIIFKPKVSKPSALSERNQALTDKVQGLEKKLGEQKRKASFIGAAKQGLKYLINRVSTPEADEDWLGTIEWTDEAPAYVTLAERLDNNYIPVSDLAMKSEDLHFVDKDLRENIALPRELINTMTYIVKNPNVNVAEELDVLIRNGAEDAHENEVVSVQVLMDMLNNKLYLVAVDGAQMRDKTSTDLVARLKSEGATGFRPEDLKYTITELDGIANYEYNIVRGTIKDSDQVNILAPIERLASGNREFPLSKIKYINQNQSERVIWTDDSKEQSEQEIDILQIKQEVENRRASRIDLKWKASTPASEKLAEFKRELEVAPTVK